MVSKTWRSLLGAAAISTMMLANAQAPRNEAKIPPVDTFAIFPSKDPERLRRMTILQSGLNRSSLDLTTEQKGRISKIVDDFVAELIVLQKSDPVEQGKAIAPVAIEKRQAAVGRLNTAVGKVMNGDQRRTWEADRVARRSDRERKMSGASQPARK